MNYLDSNKKGFLSIVFLLHGLNLSAGNLCSVELKEVLSEPSPSGEFSAVAMSNNEIRILDAERIPILTNSLKPHQLYTEDRLINIIKLVWSPDEKYLICIMTIKVSYGQTFLYKKAVLYNIAQNRFWEIDGGHFGGNSVLGLGNIKEVRWASDSATFSIQYLRPIRLNQNEIAVKAWRV